MNKTSEARRRANRESDERQGRRRVTINMDAATYAKWMEWRQDGDQGNLETIKHLMRLACQ